MKPMNITIISQPDLKFNQSVETSSIKNSSPKFAMVTPVMNSEKLIHRAIESVLNQNYPNLDYIIMDGGSTDQTVQIAKKYEPHVRVISEKDTGQSNAINKGFQLVEGDIAGWLNADDWLLPGSFNKIVKAFSDHPQAVAIYGDSQLADRNEAIIGKSGVQPFEFWRLIHSRNFIEQQSCFFRKDIFHQCGDLDESLHYVMDWDLWIRLALYGELIYIPEMLSTRLEVAENKTQSGHWKRYQEIKKMLFQYGATWKSPVMKNYCIESFANYCQFGNPSLLWYGAKMIRKLLRPLMQKTISEQFNKKCFGMGTNNLIPRHGYQVISALHENQILYLEIKPIPDLLPYQVHIRTRISQQKKDQLTTIYLDQNQSYWIQIKELPPLTPILFEFKSNTSQIINHENSNLSEEGSFYLLTYWDS